MLTAITGINWGDEGKGRMVDLISQEYDIVARYQGGNNAGHTVKNERGKFVLNLLPSGILRPNVVCVMGNGMVIDPHHLDGEINKLREQGITITPDNLKISDRATITMPYHVDQDGLEEARLAKTGAQFGSTKRGIAYTYGDKYMKKTLRMGDLVHMDLAIDGGGTPLVDPKWKMAPGEASHRWQFYGAEGTFALLEKDDLDYGVIGNPTKATKEKGDKLVEAVVEGYSELIKELLETHPVGKNPLGFRNPLGYNGFNGGAYPTFDKDHDEKGRPTYYKK